MVRHCFFSVCECWVMKLPDAPTCAILSPYSEHLWERKDGKKGDVHAIAYMDLLAVSTHLGTFSLFA